VKFQDESNLHTNLFFWWCVLAFASAIVGICSGCGGLSERDCGEAGPCLDGAGEASILRASSPPLDALKDGATSPDAEEAEDLAGPEACGTTAETSDEVAGRPGEDLPPDSCQATTYRPGQPRGSTTFLDGGSLGLLAGQPVPVWGERDGVTGPTCLPGDYVPGADRSCSGYLSWGEGPALCLSGRVPAVPSAELGSSWGLGVELPVGCAGELGQDFATVSASLSGAPPEAVRAGRLLLSVLVGGVLYSAPDDGSGSDHPLATFSSAWWSPADGEYLTDSRVRHATAFYVLVASSSSESFTVVDLCLSQVTFK